MRKIVTILFFVFLFISCDEGKDYTYIEICKEVSIFGEIEIVKKEPVRLINALSDSIVYLHAYKKFVSSLKVARDIQESFEISDVPIDFELIDENGIDIAHSTYFIGKDSIEKEIRLEVFSRKNTLPKFRESLLDSIRKLRD